MAFYYRDDIQEVGTGDLPADAIEITEEQFIKIRTEHCFGFVNRVIAGRLVLFPRSALGASESELLELYRSITIDSIQAEKSKRILNGFVSDCLGSNHLYLGTPEIREKITALIARGTGGKIECMDESTEEWARREHTNEQLLELFNSGVSAIELLEDIADAKVNSISSMTLSELDSWVVGEGVLVDWDQLSL